MDESEPQMYDIFRDRCVGTELKFVLSPKVCYISGKRLWLENAYRQTAVWPGPGASDPMFEHRWYDKNEFLVARIMGKV